jgi:NADPH-dependent 2,4-dienoyl-CoA reductase/sulfur reductase-like enzyme
LGVNLGEIIDDGEGNACGVTIKETGEHIDCGFVGLTAGVSPNVDFLKNTDLKIERGILVNAHLETNIKGVFAIGDCAQISDPMPGRKNIEAVWYTGRMMGETVAYTICEKPRVYDPGIWFNSAKFLDIEYQVYGTVLSNPPENHKSFFWQHADGEKSIRIVYDSNEGTVMGFNVMGIRFRHEVCEKWIREKANLKNVISNIRLADFNPEFFESYESDLIAQYNKEQSQSIEALSTRSLNEVNAFLKS